MATYSSILAWEFHGLKSLAGYSPWGHKESGTTELGRGSLPVAAAAVAAAAATPG